MAETFIEMDLVAVDKSDRAGRIPARSLAFLSNDCGAMTKV